MNDLWGLDPAIAFLNHGSFGACPRQILEAQARVCARMEGEPVRFFIRELEEMLDRSRREVGRLLGADPDDIAFVANATTGVNAVLRSLRFSPDDELLTTDHAYNACRNVLEHAASLAGARVVVATVPFPIASPDEVVTAVLERVTPRTRIALIDHVTSPTGLVFPIEALVGALAERGVDTLVDGAHAPGMVPVHLDRLGAAYYAGNAHKWLCAPKGSAILHVRRDRQRLIRPLTISHGANSPRTDRSRFRLEFDFTGTVDPSPWVVLPDCIRFVETLLPGGLPALQARNRDLALAARTLLCRTLGIAPPAPEAMIGSLATVPLPPATTGPLVPPLFQDPAQDALLFRHHIEVPFFAWPAWPRRLLRVSAQVYNRLQEYERLAAALPALL